MRNVGDEYQRFYDLGYNAKMQEIKEIGWESARDKFNESVPIGHKFKYLFAYYCAEGEIDALVDSKK